MKDQNTNAAPAKGAWNQTPLLDVIEAAAALKIPEHSLRKKVAARQVPFTRIGKHVRFAPHHLDAIIAAGEQAVVESGPRPPKSTARTRL